jgi:LacI family transcriptional regulator
MARATIRQIAAEAGVSIATVSRVANGHADVSAETRRTVERVIRARGYRAAARPRQGQTGLIGVAVPLVQHSYFAGILAGATEALYEHGMHVVLCPTAHSHQRELTLVERLAAGETDGAILVMPEESGAELQALVGQGFPFVVIDSRTALPDGIPVVCAAHSSGALQATQHLVELGHQRIGAITGPPGWIATQERLRGYYAALASSGMLPDPRLVEQANWTPEGGRAATLRLAGLDTPPTAIFAFNDAMAAGAVQAAAALGLRVPADISVVGFDDTIEAQVAVPALTTVRQPLAELGRTAVSLLLRQLENRRLEPLRLELETRLTQRDSTAQAPRYAAGHTSAIAALAPAADLGA